MKMVELCCSLIADVTTVEERNRFLTILEAVISSAFILGPALGGYIGSFDYMYPLYFSGAIAGIAMLCAIFLMEETNKDVRQIYQWRAEKKGKSEGRPLHFQEFISFLEEKKAVDLRIKEKYAAIRKTRDDINVKPTKLMVLCFIFEFFNRWVIQAIDSRYGYYMKDLYGFTSTMYSTLACIQSIWNCFQQGFLYGQITGKLKVPIPYLALFGVSLQCVAYFLMGWSPNVVVTILGSFLLWMGYGFASPASMSIISTTNAPEVQGKVLSWNNMCQQVSLIVSPLVLSSIYAENKHATYYSSILMSFIAVIVMLIIISMPNSRLFGKSDMKELPVTKPAQSNEVEMVKTESSPSPEKKEEEEVEVKKKGEEEKKVEKMEEEKKEEVEGNGESVEITIETPATNSI